MAETSTSARPAAKAADKSEKDEKVESTHGGGKFEFDPTKVSPLHPTAVDATGTERIVGPPIDNWSPAQVEPDEDEVKRLEKVTEQFAEARRTRLGLLTDTDRLDDTAKPLVEANKAEHGS